MARSKGQPGVLIFWELFDVLEALPGDDAKNMLSAIRGYIQRGAIPDFGDRQALTYLWLVVQPKLDADTERYEKRREQCHDAVMARWEKERQKAAAEDSKSIRPYTDESERIRKIPTTTTTTTPTTSTTTTKKDCMGGKPQRAKKFVPPTLEEVKAYATERGSDVAPERFYDYFTAGDWKDSRGNPVRSWKQKFLTWERAQPKSSQQVAMTREEDYIKHY